MYHGTNEHDINDLEAPIFIIAPAGILDTKALKYAVNEVSNRFGFKKVDALIIEEMDLLKDPRQKLSQRESALYELGFTRVNSYNLGFGKDSIGYLPMDDKSLEKTKERAESEIIKLLDSYNFDLSDKQNLYIGYVNSRTPNTSAQVFISNTLNEDSNSKLNSNYILVFGGNNYNMRTSDIIETILSLESKEMGINNPEIFSEANISYFDSDTGEVDHLSKVKGTGTRKVNVILTKSLPRNIFLDLIHLSISGMTTGDQSLCEYISLKKELPYYDKQPFKQPLVNNLKDMAKKYDVDGELQNKLDERIVGNIPFTGDVAYKFKVKDNKLMKSSKDQVDNAWYMFNEELFYKRADVVIRDIINKRSN